MLNVYRLVLFIVDLLFFEAIMPYNSLFCHWLSFLVWLNYYMGGINFNIYLIAVSFLLLNGIE
jgi:hypothetical protein